MGVPSGSNQTTYEVLMRFLMEDEDVEKSTASMVKALADIDKQVQTSNKSLKDRQKLLQTWKDELSQLKAQLKVLPLWGDETDKVKKRINLLSESIRFETIQVRKQGEAHEDLIKIYSKLENAEQKRMQMLQRSAALQNRVSSVVGNIGGGLLATGTAITAGAFTFANKYIQNAKVANELTQQWTKSMEGLALSGQRVGAVVAQEALPLLVKAEAIASKVAGFVESNPELVRAGLNIGVVASVAGFLGIAVSKGIKFTADVTYIAATAQQLLAGQLQAKAARDQLAAAVANRTASGGQIAQSLRGNLGVAPTSGAGTALKIAGTVTLLATSVIIGAELGGMLGNAIAEKIYGPDYKKQTVADAILTYTRIFRIPLSAAGLALRKFGLLTQEGGVKLTRFFEGVDSFTAKLLGIEVPAPGSQTGGNSKMGRELSPSTVERRQEEAQLVKDLKDAYEKAHDAVVESERNLQADRARVVREGARDIARENRQLAQSIRQINERADADRQRIISDFVKQSNDDQKRVESERAKIIRDGGAEIQEIEQRRLEKLRELELDHNDRMDDLKANRDALGLVLEQRKYDRERGEIDRETNLEIQKRRQDLAIRLQDLAANFAAERQQRYEQYQQDLKENEERRKAEIKERQLQHAETIREIRQNNAEQLRELDIRHREEQRRIQQALIARLRDLDAFNSADLEKRRQAHTAILAQLTAFLASLSAVAGSGRTGRAGGGARGFASGGYAYGELIQTHGIEYILNNATTRALERMLGGKLSQQGIMGLAAAGAGGGNVIWQDQRRFSGEYTGSMRDSVRRDTLDTMANALKSARGRR